jgi:hypothetical protein
VPLYVDDRAEQEDPAPTTVVCAEVATADPDAFEAVTATLVVDPRSDDVSAYVWPVAPLMMTQLAPLVLQRSHWYAYEIGAVPDQDPELADSTWPDWAVPEIVGRAVFDGAAGAACTTAVCADVAVADPAEFDAVTATRIVEPTSAETSVYAAAVAPEILTQFAPEESQRCHWYAYEIGAVPDHVPGAAVNVCPACEVPEIVGALVLAGAAGAACTTAVADELALLDPAEFDAVTTTRTVEATSAETAV